jgi:uncharacterized protein YfaS (alpha-2-macroglobulin family)
MKYSLIALLAVLSHVYMTSDKLPPYDYDVTWKKINELYFQEGKTQSAEALVGEIYVQAQKESNWAESYAAIQFKANHLIKDEDEIYNYLGKEASKAEGILQSLLYALQADYVAKFKQSRVGEESIDIVDDTNVILTKMSPLGMSNTMVDLFDKAIGNKKLQSVNLGQLKRSILEGDTIFQDLKMSAYEAIVLRFATLMTSDLGIESVAEYPYTESQSLAPLDQFLAQTFDTAKYNENYLVKAASLFQSALKSSSNPTLTYLIDKQRLSYFMEKLSSSFSQLLYKAALGYHSKTNKGKDIEVIATLDRLQIDLEELKIDYEAIAKEITDLSSRHSKSPYLTNIQKFEEFLVHPEFELRASETYTSTAIKSIGLRSRNVDTFSIEIRRVTSSGVDFYNQLQTRDLTNNFTFPTQAVKTLKVKGNTKKYNFSETNIDLGKLDYGIYLINVSTNNVAQSSSTLIQVSDISLAKMNMDNIIYANDKVKSLPLPNVTIQTFKSLYDHRTNQSTTEKSMSAITNKDGKATLNQSDGNGIKLMATKGNDVYHEFNSLYIQGKGSFEEGVSTQHIIYSDRAIYRPGQTVYFKVLALRGTYNQMKILPNAKLDVTFRDANGQDVEKIKSATTNAFGSYTGSFTIPKGRLNGSFNLGTDYGFLNIQIEEYKRPSYELTKHSQTIAKERTLPSTLEVLAKGLAGNVLNDIPFKYAIERTLSKPRCYVWYVPQMQSYTVSKGEGVTNADGIAKVTFSDDTKVFGLDELSTLTYRITVSTTDQAGESKDFVTYYSFGEKDYYFNIVSPEYIDAQSINNKISVNAFTANNDSAKVSGKLLVYENPRKKIKNYFENDFYNGENTDVSKLKLVKTIDFKSFESLKLDLPTGDYILSAQSKDSRGHQVRMDKTVSMVSFDKGKYGESSLVYHKITTPPYEPGNKITIELGSKNKLWTRLLLVKKSKIVFDQAMFLDPSNCFTYTVKEEDRGGLSLIYFTSYDGRQEQQNINLDIPFTNKKLDLKYVTLRDKSLPGAKETHQLEVRNKGLGVEAEVMVTMYDQSLDQLAAFGWQYNFYGSMPSYLMVQFFGGNSAPVYLMGDYLIYPNPIYIGGQFPNFLFREVQSMRPMYRNMMAKTMNESVEMSAPPREVVEQAADAVAPPPAAGAPTTVIPNNDPITVRENLKELVFFFPQLKSDKDGKLSYDFTHNEALTKWRLMAFAHDKDFRLGYTETSIVTQKELMVKSNKPRIIRTGDELHITANISNLTIAPIDAKVSLDLVDHLRDKVLSWSNAPDVDLSLPPGATKGVSFIIKAPEATDVELLQYTIKATSAKHSDAERDIIPVVSDKILLTESMAFHLNKGETKSVSIPKISPTIFGQTHTLEVHTNPAWIAFTALPALHTNDNPKFTSEYLRRLYQNAMAQKILESNPSFKTYLSSIDNQNSKLNLNEELKNLLLQATPYVQQSNNEELNYTLMKRYLNMNNVASEIKSDKMNLSSNQNPDGGFSWTAGERSSSYMTAEVLDALIRLEEANAINKSEFVQTKDRASTYLIQELSNEYERLKNKNLLNNFKSAVYIHELYLISKCGKDKELLNSESLKFFMNLSSIGWVNTTVIDKIRIAHLAIVKGDLTISTKVKEYFDQNMVSSPDQGIYWEFKNGLQWFRQSISDQAALIKYYTNQKAPDNAIDQMKVWLLKNKQVNGWNSDISTMDAVHALMVTGSKNEIKMTSSAPTFNFANGMVNPFDTKPSNIGWIKSKTNKDLNGQSISVANNAPHIIYGAIYTQYYKKADQVRPSQGNTLKITKELYKQVKGKSGDELILLKGGELLKPGDILVSRIIIDTDRDMSYLSLIDTRPSGFEPLNRNESRWWSEYSVDITDFQANYFFFYLNKGRKIVENKAIAVHKGVFSGGVATIQSQYSPEFVAYSEGVKVGVTK